MPALSARFFAGEASIPTKCVPLVQRYTDFLSVSSLCAGSITTFSLYGPLLLSRLRYTQFQVNAVSITAEISQYLPVSIVGFLCDRYSPRPLSLASAVFFGAGYLLAAITYGKGPQQEGGWPFGVMVVAFAGVGLGTSCMMLSSVTACAKNFARSRNKGLALAIPIAAFGLSGMWLSQVGSRLLTEHDRYGRKGDVDVHRFFLFLMGLLFTVGLLGSVALQIVDEEELIDEAVDELERSGFLEDSALLHRSSLRDGTTLYGTLSGPSSSSHPTLTEPPFPASSSTTVRKSVVLNAETRRFLHDPNMWLLAAGFFLVTGPGEAFINNLGTILPTLYPPLSSPLPASSSPATNVSIVAVASTIARLITGSLSDFLSPSPHSPSTAKSTVSRLAFLLTATFLFLIAQLLLALGVVQHVPHLFPFVSALFGLGYGATFSLVPIIISVVWGVQNFGTNWSVIAMTPAGGAAVWGAVYSAVYQAGANAGATASLGLRIHSHAGPSTDPDLNGRIGGWDLQGSLCYGWRCYGVTFWGMTLCSLLAMVFWGWAWRRWRRSGVVV